MIVRVAMKAKTVGLVVRYVAVMRLESAVELTDGSSIMCCLFVCFFLLLLLVSAVLEDPDFDNVEINTASLIT